MRSLSYGELIRSNRNFRNLLAGQFISELGNWFNFIAGLGLVRLVSGASPTAAGIFFVARLLPFALMSPIAGTFVDRFSRRKVMIATDVTRAVVALSFVLVHDANQLWIAYLATVVLHTTGAFFDGAKNATTPNLTGREGLLAGTALMFSTRFLLMAVGSGLGGWASAEFGYQVAFVINAASFLVSAYTVWLIPEEATRNRDLGLGDVSSQVLVGIPETPLVDTADERTTPSARSHHPVAGAAPPLLRQEGSHVHPSFVRRGAVEERPSFVTELKEGLRYSWQNHFALTILIMNMIWATGGGSINIVFERIGGVRFAGSEGWNPDIAVAILWTATGLGLTAGMLIAHRTSIILDRRGWNHAFIGWTLILHGVIFSIAGLMPTLALWAVFVLVSRLIVGVEYAVQETAFQRSLPDYIRGRISTLDRGAELTIFGISSYAAAEAMRFISPETLTILSGVLSALAGVVWFIRERRVKL
jgi:MFS family permease